LSHKNNTSQNKTKIFKYQNQQHIARQQDFAYQDQNSSFGVETAHLLHENIKTVNS